MADSPNQEGLGGGEFEALLQDYLGDESNSSEVRRGDVVEGTVVSVDREGVLLDIGQKSEGIVPSNDLQHLEPAFVQELKPGEQVFVYVINPENADGQAVLSLSRARAEQGWRILQKLMDDTATIEADVVEYNKGGLIVITEGVRGFVPASQVYSIRAVDAPQTDEEGGNPAMAAMVGQRLKLKVLEVNRRRNRLVLSERAAMQEVRSAQREKLLEELREGQLRKGRVTSIRPFGAFVDLGGADGLVHLSELSWNRVEDPNEIVRLGQEVEVFVLSVDQDTKRIALSLRRAQPEPWDDIASRYFIGQIVTGTVTKLVNFGAFARLDGPIEGLIHVSELTDRHILHPKEVVREGDVLALKIVRIEPDRHRLALSLKQAQDELGDDYESFLAEQNPQQEAAGAPEPDEAEATTDDETTE